MSVTWSTMWSIPVTSIMVVPPASGTLAPAGRAVLLLERLREGQQLLVRTVEIDGRAERLAHLVGRRVVELDAVVLGVVEVHAACDPVGDAPVDRHALVLQAVIERAHVVQRLDLEGDLLDE